MSTYKLTYFNFKALGEPIRFLLSYMNIDFEDNRIEIEQWPEKKKALDIPFGKLPVLEIDGKIITQSAAICRYLGKQAGLAGKNDWESLQIDSIIDTFTDMRIEMVKIFREPDEKRKQELKEKMEKETMPYYFTKFDQLIAQNNGYLANKSLSWGDIYFVSFLETIDGFLGQECTGKYSNVKALAQKVLNLPGIKEWVAKRPQTNY